MLERRPGDVYFTRSRARGAASSSSNPPDPFGYDPMQPGDDASTSGETSASAATEGQPLIPPLTEEITQ